MAVYDINRILVPDAPPEYEDHTRDVHYVPAPCQVACPIGTDAPSYIASIWDEDYEGAFEAITSTNPFSSICGRVCDAPCEPGRRFGWSMRDRTRRSKPCFSYTLPSLRECTGRTTRRSASI